VATTDTMGIYDVGHRTININININIHIHIINNNNNNNKAIITSLSW
jgi:hypothetical protein